MADYSKTRIWMSLFQQEEKDRTSKKSPQATGSLEISVADLNEFFALALALEPVENWRGDMVIKLRCGVWHKNTKNDKPYESVAVSPERGADFKEEDLIEPHTAKPPLVAAAVVEDDEIL